jgi:hypothetical protein
MQVIDNLPRAELNKALRVSKQIWVNASTELCFASIANQLEAPADWNPLILHVWPVSITRNQKGSASRILFNLAGHIIQTGAMIYQYQPYSYFSWFLTDNPRKWIGWRLSPETPGTAIGITIAWEQTSTLMGKLWWKLRYQRRLECDWRKYLPRSRKPWRNDRPGSGDLLTLDYGCWGSQRIGEVEFD